MEQCLLIEVASRLDPVWAQKAAERLSQQSHALRSDDHSQKLREQRLFDLVLNLNNLESNFDQLKELK